jgi:hypothetical protein
MAVKSDFISRYRTTATAILSNLATLHELKAQYDALAYSSGVVDGDFVGSNADLTAQQFKDALGNLETFRASFFSSFYDANVYRLKQ